MLEPHAFGILLAERNDLKKFMHEVLDRGANATLPCNLPDYWLSMLARDLELLLIEQHEDPSYVLVPFVAITKILDSKRAKKKSKVSFSEEEFLNYLQDIHGEISLEIIRRCTGAALVPASLKTIFTSGRRQIRSNFLLKKKFVVACE